MTLEYITSLIATGESDLAQVWLKFGSSLAQVWLKFGLFGLILELI